MNEMWITTYDNPFDPFTQQDRWLDFDEKSGYHTCERIARLMPHNIRNLSEDTGDLLLRDAIETLCKMYYPYLIYRPVIKGQTQRW